MDHRHTSPAGPRSPRLRVHRDRSYSVPIVEALGCSTLEAQLLLAEGRAAVHRRRTASQRNASLSRDPDTLPAHESTSSKPSPFVSTDSQATKYNPRDHLAFLRGPAPITTLAQSSSLTPLGHNRHPSDTTDSSTSTLVAQPVRTEPASENPATPLDSYSANLAQFIKAQLNNIPTYAHIASSTSPISPQSCPDLTFTIQTPPPSPIQVTPRLRAPSIIEIPPVQPPMISQFSAWSSVGEEEVDDDSSLFPEVLNHSDTLSAASGQTRSFFDHYQLTNDTSFLLEMTPAMDERDADVMGEITPSNPSTMPSLSPATTSSESTTSYFDCKRPFLVVSPHLKDRVVAAVTPPAMYGKSFMAVSPWEGARFTNVYDVVVESQHRVLVDGLSFDMQRDFVLPTRIGTPC